MSGHSKWHNIQGRKGKQDALRSAMFSKYSKLITIAAKGGGDPDKNFSLRIAIDKAKSVSMPKDNIDKAIKKGTGELNDGIVLEEALYEAFGPGGVAVLIKAVTDNKNRTVSEIKHILTKSGGSMAGPGSVAWMFEQLGVIRLTAEELKNKNISQDDFEMSLIEVGAQDIKVEEDEIEVLTKIEDLQKVLGKIKEMNIEPNKSGIEWVAKEKAEIPEENVDKLQNLFGELEEREDVEDYFTNAK
ncbi:MAG TPA: YebC/PmpR family DNA-binding transcriptional regulator [Candidatus Magasanikbacteria bacterium]|nr:YebC/PmpR family DNA-binding transcriptional regulator [Candidatus Magasanikbacteria bacterium]